MTKRLYISAEPVAQKLSINTKVLKEANGRSIKRYRYSRRIEIILKNWFIRNRGAVMIKKVKNWIIELLGGMTNLQYVKIYDAYTSGFDTCREFYDKKQRDYQP